MVWSLASSKRRHKLIEDAAAARASVLRRSAAITAVVLYNLVGFADIYSTISAIESGRGLEANPVLRAFMEHMGDGWVIAKLGLQAVISFMVLWFPHWIVLAFFGLATGANLWVVHNNFMIAGLL
ncbi:MAG: DUF5658 family protein [Pseudomonadota bacterium]